ncbi:hypothetical protein FZ029_05805 [Azospirillum sp. Sh1]|nr:hypothetical protein FZ029_05805 [Azospirillum sp. Sh1]
MNMSGDLPVGGDGLVRWRGAAKHTASVWPSSPRRRGSRQAPQRKHRKGWIPAFAGMTAE